MEAIWQEYTSSKVHIVYGDTDIGDNFTIEELNAEGYRTTFSPPITYYVSTYLSP